MTITEEMIEYTVHHVDVVCNGRMYRADIGPFFRLFQTRFNMEDADEADVERIVNDIFLKCLKGYRYKGIQGGEFFKVREDRLK